MRPDTQQYIRLAHVFDQAGLHEAADIVDGTLLRTAAVEFPPDKHEEIKQLIKDGYHKTYKVHKPEQAFSTYRDYHSFWLYPDGSVIDLDETHHGTSLDDVTMNTQYQGQPLSRDDDFRVVRNQNNAYKFMGELYGMIRVFYDDGNLQVSSYTNPTDAQFQKLQIMQKSLGAKQIYFEQTNSTTQQSVNGAGLEEWKENLHKMAAPAPTAAPTQYDQTLQQVKDQEMLATESPVWKNLERKRLYDQFPGDDNSQLRTMYEKSASVTLKITVADKRQLNVSPAKIDRYKRTIEDELHTQYLLHDSAQQIPEISGTQSFWVYPDGRIINLGNTWHGDAFRAVVDNNALDTEDDFRKMYDHSDGDYYQFMGDHFGAIRIFVTRTGMDVSSYVVPTKAQIQAIRSIQFKLLPNKLEIEQHGHVKGGEQVFKSYDEWEKAIHDFNPHQTEAPVTQGGYTDTVNNLQTQEVLNQNAPLWKAMEERRRQEQFPGPENEQLRTMYEKSAGTQYE